MRIILFLLTLWCLPVLAQQIAVPELRQQVTDITGTLSTSEQQSLTQQLQDITQKTRAQVAVLIVPSTGDDSIEQYATRVFDNWRLGDAKRNDGILIIVAWSDRTVRIQVGYGLEEKVTDALAGDIIRSNMIPAFKQQKLAKGLELAIIALNNQLTSQHQYSVNPSESESASSSDHYYFAIFWVFAVMFFPFWFFHQGSNFCRACKSSVCISAIYLLDLFLFSDKTFFHCCIFLLFFTFTTIMVFTCLCVLQKKASGRSYHSDNSGSGGGSSGGGFSGGGGSSGGGGASGRW
ncbi:TPM domain-containing protein [Escherichia coli]|uniref:TPM domain-containing protein n=2 Tax=Escherichia coli TaxID=562 RepID=UPI001485B5C7|nr:YgcG family protein [Escherichia coli]QJS62926.1 YgcG family protein [Escherichia coli]